MSDGGETYDGTRTEMDRAIRSLGVMEHILLMVAAITALIAGALVAWLVVQAVDLPYRPTWAVSSLVLFIVPAGLSWWRVRREDRAEAARRHERRTEPKES